MANDRFNQRGKTVIGGLGSDDTPRLARIDTATHTMQSIDYTHHKLQAGDHFMYTDSVTLGAESQDYLITTPDTTKWAHMIFMMDGSAITQFRLYEGADRIGTTDQTLGNSNRNSSSTPGLTIHKGQSGGSTDGTLIHQYKGGSATNQARSGTGSRNDEEIVLKQNTKYILRVTGFAADTLCNIKLEWYEHSDRS